MSSRSIGVMKVVLSFFTMSWVTWSPWCSTSLIAWDLARASLKLLTSSRSSWAPLMMCWDCCSNRSKNRTSRGMSENMWTGV